MSRIASAALAAPQRIAASTGVAQDNIIFAVVLFAFVIWITSKGELPTYIAFFKPGATQGPVTSPITATPSGGGTVPGTPVGTVLGVPGVTTLSPGATGIVTNVPGQNPNSEILNPGPALTPSGVVSSIKKFFGF